MTENIKKPSDEIDLIELIRHLWNGRRLIVKITLAFFLLGVLIAFTTPKEYKVEARLLPETKSSAGGASSILRQFAGLGGFSMPADGADAIGPALYPDVLKSTPFFLELLSSKVQLEVKGENVEVTVQEYLQKHTKKSLLSVLKKYTIGLPGTIIGWFRAEKEDEAVVEATNHNPLFRISSKQNIAIKALTDKVTSSIDQKNGVITISAEFNDPFVTAQIANFTVNYLSHYITKYRIEKVQSDLSFVQKSYLEKESEYLKAQEELAQFRDANRNVQSAAARTEEERLNNKYTLAFNVYNGLAQQLEQAKIKVQEETPVIKILEPVKVPVERSKPKRSLILVVFAFLGGFIGVGYVFGKLIWGNIREQLKTEKV